MSIKITIGSEAVIEGASKHLEREIFIDCTLDNPLYASTKKYSPYAITKVPEHLCCAQSFNKCIYVPRGFHFDSLPDFRTESVEIVDERVSVPYKFPTPKGKLRSHQRFVFGQCEKYIDDPRGCFNIVMPTGKGKTFTALHFAARLGQKVLIITNSSSIKAGWIREIESIFGIEKKDVGVIGGGKFVIKPFTIAMLQTIARKSMTPKKKKEIKDNFGLVIFDEAHEQPCLSGMNVMAWMPARYRMALTATPTRPDGLHPFIYRVFGDITSRIRDDTEITKSTVPIDEVVVVQTNYFIDMQELYFGDLEPGEKRSTFLQEQAEDAERNTQIINEAVKCAEKGEAILLLTRRVSHTLLLAEEIKKRVPETYFVTQHTPLEERDDIENRFRSGKGRVLIGTYKIFVKGTDIVPLTTLFLVTSFKNVENIVQAIGRVRRAFKKGIKRPKVFYFLDSLIRSEKSKYNKFVLKAFDSLGIENIRMRGVPHGKKAKRDKSGRGPRGTIS